MKVRPRNEAEGLDLDAAADQSWWQRAALSNASPWWCRALRTRPGCPRGRIQAIFFLGARSEADVLATGTVTRVDDLGVVPVSEHSSSE